jgi:hypothetical protein
MGIYINDAELEAMRRISPAARCAYVWLRTRMDWRTGLVGRVTSISRYAIGEDLDYEVPKGRGMQLVRIGKTTEDIKEASGRLLDVLQRVGLIVKRACAVLTFFCPLASLKESVRPNQTDHKRTTPLSTQRTTHDDLLEASNGAGFEGFEGVDLAERTTPENEQKGPNAPHIRDQGNTSTPQSPSTDLTGVHAGDGPVAGGDCRDRPTGSQAGSLERPGKTRQGSDRDRATPSQAGQLAQPSETHAEAYRDRPAASEAGGAARRIGTLADVGQSDTRRGLAEGELTSLDALCASDERVRALVAGLKRRSIRVPAAPDVLREWVAMGVTPLELDQAIDRAVSYRQAANSQQRITVGYVGPMIPTMRGEARRAVEAARRVAARPAKKPGERDIEALARQLGMWPARSGESWPAFTARVMDAAEAQMGHEHG